MELESIPMNRKVSIGHFESIQMSKLLRNDVLLCNATKSRHQECPIYIKAQIVRHIPHTSAVDEKLT